MNSYLVFHLYSLYQLAQTERRPFQRNHNDLGLALNQRNGSEGTYGHNVSNVSSKNKICIFFCWFSFYFTLSEFLYQYISSYIILNQITENILNTLISIFIQKLLGHFP